MAKEIAAFRDASEMLRDSSFSIEEQIRNITAQMDAMNKEAAEKPEKGGPDEKPEPFEGHSVALDTLFVIAFFLIRLLNQKGLSDIIKLKLTNYFEHFKRMIDIYSYMLVIGHSIGYPKEIKSKNKSKNTDKELNQKGGGIEIQDNLIFLRELNAFYSFLFMAVSSNSQLKGVLEYPSNPSFKERIDWLGFLTPKEDAQLIKKESLATQDQLFQNIMDVFTLLFDKFQIVADVRSEKLAEQFALVNQLNEKVDMFNSVKPQKPNMEPEQNALAQTEELETIMKEGLVPVKDLKVLAQQLADSAGTVQQQLYAESTPDKDILKRVYGSISKLLSSKGEAVTAPPAFPASPASVPPSLPASPASVTQGGYRLRKSRKAQYKSNRTLRRSKRL